MYRKVRRYRIHNEKTYKIILKQSVRVINLSSIQTTLEIERRHSVNLRQLLMNKEEPIFTQVPTVLLFDQNKTFHSFGYDAQKKYQELLSRDNHREWYLFKEFKMTLFQTKEAGILDEMLSLALEPEAASVYCRETFSCVGNVGTRYILLDLGGGTADITCHKVVDAVKTFKEKYLNEYWEMLADFEMSKRKFDGNDQLIVKFPARLDEIYGEHESIDDVLQRAGCSEDIKIKRGKMHISKDKGQWIFDETIDQIIERTQSLLNVLENVDYIVLVGGFSESKYLQTRMKAEFGDKVVAPTEPRTAVMKGAVLFGQRPTAIQTRVSKYTYGIATMEHFKPEIHSENKRIVIDGHDYCDDIFEKHVTIGQEITVGQNMKEMTYHPTIDDQAHFVLQVFASSTENPKYVTDEECQQIGLLLVEIDTGGNRNFEIKVKLVFGGTEIQVEVRDGLGNLIKDARMDFLG
ncbi:HS12B-like protein [Mya arenaria]|uniref:HS12B-like protein n=1 Tax=Mya arenaria TaxID=6604 RepID=A0ABY7DTC1_MYAAR|nr:HS12B-like protein [Mya arenaria]